MPSTSRLDAVGGDETAPLARLGAAVHTYSSSAFPNHKRPRRSGMRAALSLLLGCSCLCIASFASAESASERLARLGDEYWQANLRNDPVEASSLGDRRYDHQRPVATRNAFRRWHRRRHVFDDTSDHRGEPAIKRALTRTDHGNDDHDRWNLYRRNGARHRTLEDRREFKPGAACRYASGRSARRRPRESTPVAGALRGTGSPRRPRRRSLLHPPL